MTSLCVLALTLLVFIPYADPAPTYVVEAYFVVDPKVVKKYYYSLGYRKKALETIQQDVDFFMYELNKYFKTMKKHGLDIEIRMKKLDVLDFFSQSKGLFNDRQAVKSQNMEQGYAIKHFQEWLGSQNSYQDIGYDLAIAWTGYNLFENATNSNAIKGRAKVESVCSKTRAIGVAEFDGTQSTVFTTAHEIGHILGADHDNSTECPSFEKYIMSSTGSALSKNRWDFSACTAKSIKKYIETLDKDGTNCLVKTTTPAMNFDLSSQLNRDVLDVQKICQRAKRYVEAFLCTYDHMYNDKPPRGDVLCQRLYCSFTGYVECKTAFPTEGIVCDQGKRCERGKCVKAPKSLPVPPISNPDCMFGDVRSHWIDNTAITCKGWVDRFGANRCYKDSFKHMCCESCAFVHS